MSAEEAARTALGLDGPLELLRASGSSVFRAREGIVRVATGGEELLSTARTLHEAGAPVAALLAGPTRVGELVVSLWQDLPDDGSRDGSAMGRALRRFHEAGAGVTAPAWDPLGWLDGWLGTASDMPTVAAIRDRVRAGVAGIGGATVLLHTDAHRGNFRIDGGEAWLVDLEQVAIGPAGYDLAALEVTERRFRGDASVFDAFRAAYGRETGGLAAAVAVREALAVGFVLGLGHVDVARERLAQLEDRSARWQAY